MAELNVALVLGAGTVLVLGLVSGYVKNRLWLFEPLLAMLLGIAIGPVVFDFAVVELHERMQTAVARFFDIPIFIFFGAVVLWQAWQEIGWTGVAFALAVLLLRRLPAWFLLRPLLPSVRDRRETLSNGWFGPIGIAAIFYATELQHRVEPGEQIWAIVSLVVFASILLYGITAMPLTRAVAAARRMHRRNPASEGTAGQLQLPDRDRPVSRGHADSAMVMLLKGSVVAG